MVAPVTAPVPTPTPTPTPSIWSEFVDTIGELAGSKKFLVLLSSVITWVALRLGWHVDQTTINYYLGLVAAFLVAQGVADHGKGKAEVEAKAIAAARAAGERTPGAGFIGSKLLLVLGLIGAIGAVTMTGCPHAGQVVLATGQCVLDTGVLGTVLVDLASANYAALIADAITKLGPTLVTCALQAIAASETPAPTTDAGVGSATAARRGVYDPVVVARAKEMLVKYGVAR